MRTHGTQNWTARKLVPVLAGALMSAPLMSEAADRVAIVLGNGNYVNTSTLPNPANDAARISAKLKKLGFQVETLIDASREDLEQLQMNAGRLLAKADVGLFFYAGHGLQIDGENYMVPVDATFADPDNVAQQLVSMTRFLSEMEKHADTNIIFLDACRNNPFADAIETQLSIGRSMSADGQTEIRDIGKGLAEMKASAGTLIAYATQPGNVAEDGTGSNSPFTSGILQNISKPGVEIREILTQVRVSVLNQTNQRQIPWDHSSLTEEFYFIEPVRSRDIPIPPP